MQEETSPKDVSAGGAPESEFIASTLHPVRLDCRQCGAAFRTINVGRGRCYKCSPIQSAIGSPDWLAVRPYEIEQLTGKIPEAGIARKPLPPADDIGPSDFIIRSPMGAARLIASVNHAVYCGFLEPKKAVAIVRGIDSQLKALKEQKRIETKAKLEGHDKRKPGALDDDNAPEPTAEDLRLAEES